MLADGTVTARISFTFELDDMRQMLEKPRCWACDQRVRLWP